MIWISESISQEELLSLKNDLNILYPKCAITREKSQKLQFMIVSYNEFSDISNNTVPILTPISIHQMIEKEIDTRKFTLPVSGYKNLNLFLKKMFFSGFGSTKNQLKEMCRCMGAVIEHVITKNTDILIAKSYQSEVSQAALSLKVPILQDKYIYDSFDSPFPLNESDYTLPLYSGMIFTTSCLSGDEKETVRETIIQNGGKFTSDLYNNTTVIVTKQLKSSPKLKCSSDLGITTITENLQQVFNSPESLCKTIGQPLIVSNLFNHSNFYLSPKLDRNLSDELSQLIHQNQGEIIQNIETANYIITMDNSDDNKSNSNNERKLLQRTPIWVERCIQENKILHVSDFPLFTPTKTPRRVNDQYYVSITGFDRSDYLQIISSLKWLNIKFSPQFKKSMTHLIAKENHESKKKEAAERWSIPIVGIDWLFKVAEGSLTSVPLSNPWSQQSPILNKTPKKFIELSDDTDDIPIPPIHTENSINFLDDDDDIFDETLYDKVFSKKTLSNEIINESKLKSPLKSPIKSNKSQQSPIKSNKSQQSPIKSSKSPIMLSNKSPIMSSNKSQQSPIKSNKSPIMSSNQSPRKSLNKSQQSPTIKSPKKKFGYLSDSSSEDDDELFSLADSFSNSVGSVSLSNKERSQSTNVQPNNEITIFAIKNEIESHTSIPTPPINDSIKESDSPAFFTPKNNKDILPSKEITPPPTTIIHNQNNSVEIGTKLIPSKKSVSISQVQLNQGKPQKPLISKRFLDDSDDDNYDEIIEKDRQKKIEDATKSILKGINKKKFKARKLIKTEEKMPAVNIDYQFDSIGNCTQRPVHSDDDDVGMISYEDTKEKVKPVSNGKDDILLSLLQDS